jgi:hypothetical protein
MSGSAQQPGQPEPYGQQPEFYLQQLSGYPGSQGDLGGKSHRKKVLPWLIAGGGIVIGGVVVALLFVFGVFDGSSTSTPDGVLRAAAGALNKQDTTALNGLGCDGSAAANAAQDMQNLRGASPTWSVTGTTQAAGNGATGTLHLSASSQGHVFGINFTLTMNQRKGRWCVPNGGMTPEPNSETIDGKPAATATGSGG